MAYEKSSSKKNSGATRAALVISLGLIASAMIIRNGLLKTDSGRYEMPSGQLTSQCMLFDTKTGNCYGVVDGEVSRFNLRKTKYKDKSDLRADSLAKKNPQQTKKSSIVNPKSIVPSDFPETYAD